MMEALWLLAKVNTIFQIVEKCIYAGIALFMTGTTVRYIRDYKQSVEDEKHRDG